MTGLNILYDHYHLILYLKLYQFKVVLWGSHPFVTCRSGNGLLDLHFDGLNDRNS